MDRVFIGPEALPAPPWGSVYSTLKAYYRGSSTLALSEFYNESV
ncbi:molecular chaperone TorD family protein [Providencia rettgeri]|nr:molecular chaperone TorD family protein [Providencia rettgeri]